MQAVLESVLSLTTVRQSRLSHFSRGRFDDWVAIERRLMLLRLCTPLAWRILTIAQVANVNEIHI